VRNHSDLTSSPLPFTRTSQADTHHNVRPASSPSHAAPGRGTWPDQILTSGALHAAEVQPLNSTSHYPNGTSIARSTQPMLTAHRLVATEHAPESSAEKILVKQRLQRPVSPHLSIYRPQITWYASSLNRITGVMLSGGLYVFGLAYLAAPALGWHLETPSLVAAFGSLPLAAKVAAKMTIAFPFTFHSLNGVRHLIWDLGVGYATKTVIRTGWTVVGLSVLSSLYLALV